MVSSVVACLSFLALSSLQFLSNADSDLIRKTCEKTLHKDLCMSEFSAVPESKNADLDGLAKIALELAAKHANEIHEKIQDLSDPSNTAVHQHLNDCSDDFQDAIEQFEDTRKALESKSYSDVNTWVSSAMSDAQSCEDGFKEVSDDGSPLTDLNNTFSSLCSIVLKICDQLDGKA